MDERVDTGIMDTVTDPLTIREGEKFTVAVNETPAAPLAPLAPLAKFAALVMSPPPEPVPEKPEPVPEIVEPVIDPAVVKAAKQALIRLPEMSHHDLAKLAQEVAMDMKPLHDIISVYNLTQGQYEYILENIPFFKHALETAAIEWNSALSTAERIKVEAAHALEATLPDLAARMGSKTESLNHAVEAGKLFAKLAGLDSPDPKSKGPGERFTITINLGSDQIKHQTKTINAPATEAGASSGATTLRIDSKGP